MEKIVQLRENEYNTLKKRADMNQAAIDKAMEQEIKKSCNITIELEMNVGRDWNDVFSVKPYVDVSSGSYNPYNSIEPPKVLSYEACKKTCCTHTTLDDRNCGKTLWFQHRAGK